MSIERIQKARAYLNEGYTCALIQGDEVLLSRERGVAPLLAWLEQGSPCRNAVAADKVVGKAAAYLYVLLGVAFVHANILSESAAQVLKRFGVEYSYLQLVTAIRNRKGDGFCPMEQAVWDIDDPQTAHARIIVALQALRGEK